MRFAPGTRLGPYEVVSPLGAGGMGEVYRATDPRLGRDVAIKVLPAALSLDPDRLRRFEQEARAAGVLNHPNVTAVHDAGTAEDGSPYLVQELLEGHTLRSLLSKGDLPTRKTLNYALQIAHGLAAAQDKGIVHRDLKPENVFVTHEGRVKILDFGLAKLTRPERERVSASAEPMESLETESGVVMGTVSYMSPEQVRGLPADCRSDIFSFGSILYEMLAGVRAFRGDSLPETMMAILDSDPPDLLQLNPTIPPGLDRIVRHCLEKGPEARFQSAKDLAFDIEAFLGGSGAAPQTAQSVRGPRRFLPYLAIPALLALLAMAFLAGSRGAIHSRHDNLPTFHQLTFRRGYVFSARFAPDGQTIIFGGSWNGDPVRLFSARANGVESTPLSLPAADVLSISSAGELAIALERRFKFYLASVGTLARAPLSGAAPRHLLEDVQEADWAPDGKALAVVRRVADVHRLEFPPGKVLCTTTGWFSYPRFSPDGGHIAFLDHPSLGDDRGVVAAVDLDGKKQTLTSVWASEQGLAWSPSGEEVLFTAAQTGTQRALYGTSLAGKQRVILRAPAALRIHDVFRDGRVLLSRDTLRSGILSLAPGETRERDLSWQDGSILVDLANDGKTLLFSEQGSGASANYDVYIRGTDASAATRLGEGMAQALSPDGKWVLTLVPQSPQELVLWPTGPGEPRHLKTGNVGSYGYIATWMPDSKRIVFAGREADHGLRLFIQEIDGIPRPITPEGIQPSEFGVLVSPDGKSATGIGPDGKALLYPIEGGQPRMIPAVVAGEEPVGWGEDAETIYILNRSELTPSVHRLNLSTGSRAFWRRLAPTDPTGLIGIPNARVALGGKAYAYSYWLLQSDLYVVEGLR